nr:MAG TPA: hypothetical protein [Caudoviricetes sp.]
MAILWIAMFRTSLTFRFYLTCTLVQTNYELLATIRNFPGVYLFSPTPNLVSLG